MKETVITWTIGNWITVVLMFVGAAIIFALGMKAYHAIKAGNSDGG